MKTTQIARKHSSFRTCNSSKNKYNFTNEVPKCMFRLKIVNNAQRILFISKHNEKIMTQKQKYTSFPIEIL